LEVDQAKIDSVSDRYSYRGMPEIEHKIKSTRRWEVLSPRLFQWHGITKTLLRICNSSAVKTDMFRILGNGFDLLKFAIACQNTDMPRVIPFAGLLCHRLLLQNSLFKITLE
jgi:hypothetical protein